MTLFLKFICIAAALNPPTVVEQVAQSGRCVTVASAPDARVAPTLHIVPGPPPLLSFRYYEGRLHHRFNNSDLMLDDAGH